MITYILIGLLTLIGVTLGSYFFSINIIYKKINKKNIDIRNTFPFEVVPQKKTDNFFINSLYLIYLLVLLASTIVFAFKFTSVLTVVIAVATFFITLFLSILPFTSFVSLKKHLYLNVGVVILFFLVNGLLTYLSYSICKLTDYHNATAIVSLVVSALIFLFSLCFVANPRLFDLKMQVKEEDVSRPKVIPLALSEWLLMFSAPLFLIPLILLATVL